MNDNEIEVNFVKRFLDAHPKVTTALHVMLAALPTALMLMTVLGVVYLIFTLYEAFDLILLISFGAGYGLFFGAGLVSWALSLLLYRFTHAVRENWPDWLRIMLIRFNIFGGFMAMGQVLIWIMLLVRS